MTGEDQRPKIKDQRPKMNW